MNTPKQTFSQVLHNPSACDRIIAKQRPYKCPACNRQSLLFLLPETTIKALPVKCKRCGAMVIVNILNEPEP